MKMMGDTTSATIIITKTVALPASISFTTGLTISGNESTSPGAYAFNTSASDFAPSCVTLSALSTMSLQIHLTEKREKPADAATVKILITDLEKPLLAPVRAPKSAHTTTMANRPTEMYAPMLPLLKVGCMYSIILVKFIISVLSVKLDTTIILHFSGKVKPFKIFMVKTSATNFMPENRKSGQFSCPPKSILS